MRFGICEHLIEAFPHLRKCVVQLHHLRVLPVCLQRGHDAFLHCGGHAGQCRVEFGMEAIDFIARQARRRIDQGLDIERKRTLRCCRVRAP